MSNRKVVITNGEEGKTVEIKDSDTDVSLDASDGWVIADLGDDETESLEWRLVMAEHHNKRLSYENAALREALRLKEAGCEALAKDKSVLLAFVKRVSDSFDLIGDIEPLCDAYDFTD